MRINIELPNQVNAESLWRYYSCRARDKYAVADRRRAEADFAEQQALSFTARAMAYRGLVPSPRLEAIDRAQLEACK